ncbi:MAG: hypothetical protein UX49_C0050G0004 [Candidatus Wolfebacteria bacterium GW2011_GWC2_46_275]|nr:MAG: hypothetical protein UX49_C0050G0004 [Candidatus Wolfebacteria bacterium GW2011_GWC2_46_275]
MAAAALALPAVSSAQNLPGAAAPSGTGVDPIIAILNTVGNWMFGILIAVAAIYILLAAFKFLTAKGDAKVIADARQALTYSIEVAKAVARGSGI